MRIECENENCGATYTIDDSQLSDTPIGAQCPYCGHVKLVQKGGGNPSFPASTYGSNVIPMPNPGASVAGPAPTIPPAAPSPFGGGAPSPISNPPTSTGGFGVLTSNDLLNTGDPQPMSSGGTGGLMSAGSANLQPVPGPSFEPGVGPMFAGGTAPAEGPRFGGPSLDLSLSDDVSPGNNAFMPTSHDLGNVPQVSVATGPSNCQVCGKNLIDEFDKVIGLCDEHQRDRRFGENEAAAPAPAVASSGVGAQWHARSPDGRVAGPMTLEELRSGIRNGAFPASDEFSRDGIDFGPMSRFKELAYLASLSMDLQASGPAGGSYGRPSFGGPDISRFVTPFLLLLILGGIGYLGYDKREQLSRVVQGLLQDEGPKGPQGPNPLIRYRQEWAAAHPEVSGTAVEYLVTANARHLEDTWSGYRQANQAFQRALLVDIEDAAAIAGYAENLILWRYATTPPDELAVLEKAARYASELKPQDPTAHRALGALAYLRGDLNGCRAGADAALQRDATDGRAKLLLAECFMEGNVALAITEAERAQQLLPELRRADRVRGRAYAKQGRYASAFQVLSDRMKVDGKNATVIRLYGDVSREVGEANEARAYYNRALRLPGDRQATLLALAELALQSDQPDEAASHYRAIVKEGRLFGARGARTYTGWARAELQRRRGQRALQLADQALKYSPRDTAALLARGEASLVVGSATTAAVSAKQAESSRPGEPAMLVLAGRALAVQERYDEAVAKVQQAMTNDPRDPRLKGVLAGIYLRQGGVAQAFALMRRATDVDPQSVPRRTRAGLLAVSAGAVSEAIGQFRRAAIDERNASVAYSSIGLLYYHLGDRNRAAGAVERALRLDDANLTALVYRAQLALDRGDKRAARKAAQKVLAVERGSALGYLLLSRSLCMYKVTVGARRYYAAALRSDPAMIPAKVELAGLNLDTDDRSKAIQELQGAFLISPSNLTIRRLLLKAGL